MFRRLLIANRGEIACRVIRTCRRLGVETVAVFSDADRDALFTTMADEALWLGPAPATDSYLRIERIVAAAQASGAEAIHPGYGFLSENAGFARAVREAGLVFVGPSPEAIEAMGLKDAAKALMQRAGVPIVPGYHGDDQSDGRLASEAKALGFPLLIKAVAGGGGKGMRRVAELSEFRAALDSARKEAQSAFGDARVLLERYMDKPRHVEVQVLADGHGNTLALHERDCSLQRRHQKLVEEAPAPGMSRELRARICEAAVAAARAVHYEGAGTIEMIADSAQGLSPDRIYFMEMNTRLQVEHPVTEMITGLDLVEWQLRVAAGERLPWTQSQIALRGHAIEVRICAEEPAQDYAPRSGTLLHVAWPEHGPHVRIETGVQSGDQVSVHYDSMLAKLVVWDHEREGARRRMEQALARVELLGIAHNVAFLRAALGLDEFRSGDVHTGVLTEHQAELVAISERHRRRLLLCALLAELHERERSEELRSACFSPWSRSDAFRISRSERERLTMYAGGREFAAELRVVEGAYEVELLAETSHVSAVCVADHTLTFMLDGVRVRAAYALSEGQPRTVHVTHDGAVLEVAFAKLRDHERDQGAQTGALRAPLPGRVLSLFVQQGSQVVRGDPLLSLEAMKMEHTLRASGDGIVKQLHVAEREQVAEGTVLLVLEAQEAS